MRTRRRLFLLDVVPIIRATGAAAKAVPTASWHLDKLFTVDSLHNRARRVEDSVVATDVTGIVNCHLHIGIAAQPYFSIFQKTRYKLRVMHDLKVRTEAGVFVFHDVKAVRTVRHDPPCAVPLKRFDILQRELLEKTFFAEASCCISRTRLLRSEETHIETASAEDLRRCLDYGGNARIVVRGTPCPIDPVVQGFCILAHAQFHSLLTIQL
ncbi:hypothetical protein HYPGJ_30732 [Hyphomicrobium sp. GJ21]|nr:hypothetical protein HYPGJ_30732 [Hyphomicrobium sp. GJ21]